MAALVSSCQAPEPVATAGGQATPTLSATVVVESPPAERSLVPAPRRSEVASLEVPGFLPAVLLVPAITEAETRPLVAAAHGAGGSPEWECDYWSRLTRDRPFILCLRGTRMGQGMFYYPNHHALAAELDAAVAAARARYPNIARGGGLYAGFSQGASMGSLMIATRAAEFPYVVLIEGFTQWSQPLARSFAKSGGKAVLWACGTKDCATKATASASALEKIGVRARAETAAGAGHTPLDAVMDRVATGLPWLVQGDDAWGSARESAQP